MARLSLCAMPAIHTRVACLNYVCYKLQSESLDHLLPLTAWPTSGTLDLALYDR
jgi:hypothetical protein